MMTSSGSSEGEELGVEVADRPEEKRAVEVIDFRAVFADLSIAVDVMRRLPREYEGGHDDPGDDGESEIVGHDSDERNANDDERIGFGDFSKNADAGPFECPDDDH